ncbi:MAG: amidohydrolase [Bacteroidetes bacterium]|nr:MAG: amidohydrolase [Bacteroidota bacterium]
MPWHVPAYFLIINDFHDKTIMKISIIQTALAWEDKSTNFKNLGDLISQLNNKTDLVILPEMFNTGFSMNTSRLGESACAETFIWMSDIAEKGNFGLCGSYIVKEGEKYYNRWVFISPEKESWYYDKRHLFSIAGEDKIFSPGRKKLIFKFRGVRISPYICYDLRFPVWSRNRNDYDLMINSANWPESRISVWNTLLKTRAIENQCYVAGANITGTDGEGIKYCGDSVIINPKGEIINSANQNEETVITGDISISDLSDFRKKFPVMNDADNFTIDI